MFHREGLVPVWTLLSPRCSEEGPIPRTPSPPGCGGAGHGHWGSGSPLSSRTPRRPGVACVCTRACVSVASGNREKGSEKQMGPPRLPLACKLKGGENRNKTRKQLWQDNSSVGGGSGPRGLAVCQDSARRRRAGITKNSVHSLGGAHSAGRQIYPPPCIPSHSPGRTVKWRLRLFFTTLEKICKQEPSLLLVVRYVLWLPFLQPHINPPTSFKPGLCPGFGTKVNSRFAQHLFLSMMDQDDTLTRQKRHLFSHNHWLHFKSYGTLSPGTFGLGSSEKFRGKMWQLGGRA